MDANWIVEQAAILKSSPLSLTDELIFNRLTDLAIAFIQNQPRSAGSSNSATPRLPKPPLPTAVPDFIFDLGICRRDEPLKKCRANRKIEAWVQSLQSSGRIDGGTQTQLLLWGLGNALPLEVDGEFTPDTAARARALGLKMWDTEPASKIHKETLKLNEIFGGESWWDEIVYPKILERLTPKLANQPGWCPEVNYLVNKGLFDESDRAGFKDGEAWSIMYKACYRLMRYEYESYEKAAIDGGAPDNLTIWVVPNSDAQHWYTTEKLFELRQEMELAGVEITERHWKLPKDAEQYSETDHKKHAAEWERCKANIETVIAGVKPKALPLNKS
jgi:hypothetical protein